jgi:hypothetical protein
VKGRLEHTQSGSVHPLMSGGMVSPRMVDTKVAAALCIGGACTYMLDENAVLPQAVVNLVVPEINNQFGSQVALVLGTALLWCVFNSSLSHLVPIFIQDRVNASIELPEGVNPVERRLLVVTGDNENISLTQVSQEEVTTRMETGGGSSRDLLAALMSQIQQQVVGQLEQMRRQAEINRNEDHAMLERQYRVHNKNIKRIAIAPARDVGPAHVVGRSIGAAALQMVATHLGDPKAVLSATPRNLYFLWDKWASGLNGNKPASQFPEKKGGQDHQIQVPLAKVCLGCDW